MFEFTNYQYPITKENFINFIDTQKNYKTIVIYSEKEKRIIGAGTIIIVHEIDFLKIDTEGHEMNVLLGFEEEIKKCKLI